MENIWPDELQGYMANRLETEYVVVDIRSGEDFAREHIPGSLSLPVRASHTDYHLLPGEREIIFYCERGAKSLAAALIYEERFKPQKKVYHLVGGIDAWMGRVTVHMPRIRVFKGKNETASILFEAMNLEKGAWNFYGMILKKIKTEKVLLSLKKVKAAEVGHMKAIYGFWKNTVRDAPPFDRTFKELKGDIIESGEPLSQVIEKIQSIPGNTCESLLEAALYIELAAFDLYKTASAMILDPVVQEAFLSLAQEEKLHIERVAEAVDYCGSYGERWTVDGKR